MATFSSEVDAAIERALAAPDPLWITDADGTLWSDDIGEAFLRALADDGALVSPEAQGIEVWAEYERRVEIDRASGFAWAVQVMAGMSEAEVVRRADALASAFVPKHLFPEMKTLLDRSAETWIVSASNHWIVRAAAPLIGIPADRVLGIRVTVDGGRLTSTLIDPVTYAQGKADAIRQHIGRMPSLVSGDSRGDLEMMQLATGAALVVSKPKGIDPSLRDRGWPIHRPHVFGPQ